MDDRFLYERSRVLMAYELKIPPDDLDLDIIFHISFRAIREYCEGDAEEIAITGKNNKEKEAIFGEYGQIIINRIFENEHPFDGIADQYQEWYISEVLNKIDERE